MRFSCVKDSGSCLARGCSGVTNLCAGSGLTSGVHFSLVNTSGKSSDRWTGSAPDCFRSGVWLVREACTSRLCPGYGGGGGRAALTTRDELAEPRKRKLCFDLGLGLR